MFSHTWKYISYTCLLVLPFLLQAGCAQNGQGTNNVLSNIFNTVAKDAMDAKAKLSYVDVVERRGDSIVIRVHYENLLRYNGVQISGRVMSGGRLLSGFNSTVATTNSENGDGELTLSWVDAKMGTELRSDQVEIMMRRGGNTFKDRVFNLSKEWTAMTEAESADSNSQIAVGNTNTSQSSSDNSSANGKSGSSTRHSVNSFQNGVFSKRIGTISQNGSGGSTSSTKKNVAVGSMKPSGTITVRMPPQSLIAGRFYKLLNVNSKRYLAVKGPTTNNGGNVVIWHGFNQPDIKWQLLYAGNGYYKFKNKYSGKYLAVDGARRNNGANIIQWDDVKQTDILWKPEQQNNGTYKLRNKESNKYVAVDGGRTNEGANVLQWDDVNQRDIKWEFILAK